MIASILLAAALAATPVALDAPPDHPGKGHTPVTVCHLLGNGDFNIITIDEEALDAHISHGDTYPIDGVCFPPDGTGENEGKDPEQETPADPPVEGTDPTPEPGDDVEVDEPGSGGETPVVPDEPVTPDEGTEPEPQPEPTPDPETPVVTDPVDEQPIGTPEDPTWCPDGYAMAEDMTCVPDSFWDEPAPVVTPVIVDTCEPVTYGDVSQAEWDALLAAGWKGDPTDGAERLYCPDAHSKVSDKAVTVVPAALTVDEPAKEPATVVAKERDALPETGATSSILMGGSALLLLGTGAFLLRAGRAK
jgi:LPXTG-motif cell wall-anchored protein